MINNIGNKLTVKNLIILFMGRISPIKGPDLLIEAFALLIKKHKNINLILAGPWEEKFLAKIKFLQYPF